MIGEFVVICVAGTIGSEPEPIESRQFSSKDKLATAGIFGGGSKGKQNDTYPSTPQPPGSTVPSHLPTTDENMSYGRLINHLKSVPNYNHYSNLKCRIL